MGTIATLFTVFIILLLVAAAVAVEKVLNTLNKMEALSIHKMEWIMIFFKICILIIVMRIRLTLSGCRMLPGYHVRSNVM